MLRKPIYLLISGVHVARTPVPPLDLCVLILFVLFFFGGGGGFDCFVSLFIFYAALSRAAAIVN